MMRIRKDDVVAVISGKDRGKQGSVIAINTKKSTLKVKDIALQTRHRKARRQGESPRIVSQEGFIDSSRVMPVCSSCRKPTRVGFKVTDQDVKIRICCRCDSAF